MGLVGILVQSCSKCRSEVPTIPHLGALHRVIESDLIKKASLRRGDEIKFLRKNVGVPAKRLAAQLGITPEHLSRVENGKLNALSPAGDKLVRAIIMAERDGGGPNEASRKMLLEAAADKVAERSRPVVELVRGRWVIRKVA